MDGSFPLMPNRKRNPSVVLDSWIQPVADGWLEIEYDAVQALDDVGQRERMGEQLDTVDQAVVAYHRSRVAFWQTQCDRLDQKLNDEDQTA